MRPYKGHNPEGISDSSTRDAVLAMHEYLKQLNQTLGTPSQTQTGDVTIYQTSVKTNVPDSTYQDVTVSGRGTIWSVTALSMAGAQGDILYHNGTRFTNLPAGTSGQELQTRGPGANPFWANRAPKWWNVLDFPTFQAAIDAANSGDVIYVPAGTYTSATVPAVGPMTITGKKLGIVGDSINSIIEHSSASTDLLTISGLGANGTYLRHLYLKGANTAGAGRGIVLKGQLSTVSVQDTIVTLFPSWALDTDTGGGDIIDCTFDRSYFTYSASNGCIRLNTPTVTTFRFNACTILTGAAGGNGVLLGGAFLTTFDDCIFENGRDAVSADGDTDSMVKWDTTALGVGGALTGLTIRDCWFETTATSNATPNNWFIFLKAGSNGVVIENNFFGRMAGATVALRAIKSKNGAAGMESHYLHISKNNGQVTAVHAGTDDIVLGANDSALIERCYLLDSAAYNKPFRLSGGTSTNLTRVDANYRMKLKSLSTADRALLTDVLPGDVIFCETNTQLELWDGGAWRGMNEKQTNLQFRDEGVNIGGFGIVSSVNFTGAGVTATEAANALTVTIPGSLGVDFVGHFTLMGG